MSTATPPSLGNRWFYPVEMEHDLADCDLPRRVITEVLACSWEYNRCVVPEFTNRDRYLALARLAAIAVIAESRGRYADSILTGDTVLGYNIREQLDILFGGTAMREPMEKEYLTCILLMTEKASNRRGSRLFRKFIDAMAYHPADFFRLRDMDGLFRFYLNGAIACNDCEDWLAEHEMRALMELVVVMYDTIAYYKHRAEGEPCTIYAYADPAIRREAYHRHRETLWAIDIPWSDTVAHRCAVNFCRYVGGPIHMMMRRYRFVDDDLIIGKPETEEVVEQTRHNVKNWYRNDHLHVCDGEDRYDTVIAQKERLFFDGFDTMLNRPDHHKCARCRRKNFYGADGLYTFTGVDLCTPCTTRFNDYILGITDRAARALPLAESR